MTQHTICSPAPNTLLSFRHCLRSRRRAIRPTKATLATCSTLCVLTCSAQSQHPLTPHAGKPNACMKQLRLTPPGAHHRRRRPAHAASRGRAAPPAGSPWRAAPLPDCPAGPVPRPARSARHAGRPAQSGINAVRRTLTGRDFSAYTPPAICVSSGRPVPCCRGVDALSCESPDRCGCSVHCSARGIIGTLLCTQQESACLQGCADAVPNVWDRQSLRQHVDRARLHHDGRIGEACTEADGCYPSFTCACWGS